MFCDCAEFNTREFGHNVLMRADGISLKLEEFCLLAMLCRDLPAILKSRPVPSYVGGRDTGVRRMLEPAKMKECRRSLDHYVIQVRDLDTSGATYERLGFQVMPRMRHIEIGSANRVVQFRNTYLELIGDLDRARSVVGDNLSARWACGEGLSMVSLDSDDIEEDHAWVEGLQLDPAPIISARRKVTMPDGSEDETDSVCFYIFRPDRKYLSLFLSQHRKPGVIWVNRYQQHPNTAFETSGVIWVSDDPARERDYFAALFGSAPEHEEAGLIRFRGARGDCAEIYSRERLGDRFPGLEIPVCDRLAGYPAGLQIAVGDLDRLRSILETNGVESVDGRGRVSVGPDQTHGVAIEFVAAQNDGLHR